MKEGPVTGEPEAFEEHITRGVSILRGDPRAAVRKLSGPMIVAMFLMAIYNLADAIWVAGLGPDALAAVGFVVPLFMILIGLSNGLGAGVTSVVSRRIGARDKAGADRAAVHSLLIVITAAVLLTVLFVPSIDVIVTLMGGESVSDLSAEYGSIVFLGTIFFLYVQCVYAILRAEGDTRRTMYAMAASSILNIVLDPILIYGAGLGVAGAALATVISVASVAGVLTYWFVGKKDTYVNLSFRDFRPEGRTIRDILGVGLPASFEFFLMSMVVIINNGILVTVAGTDAVAVFTSGWRIVMFAIVPLTGITTSLVSVAGAAYGAREYEKIRVALTYSLKIGVGLSLLTSALTYILAPQITTLFTYTPESASLAPAFILFFRTMCLFYPFVPFGMFSSSVFQGTGHGITSLVINLLRNLVFIAVFAYLLGIVFGLGEVGVYFGIVAGNILGTSAGYIWVNVFLSRLTAASRGETTG
ncbi:MAG: MATE family efflux transporter [Methanomicrobiaceae archaeon]|nr:MATE family efflux transporter [Methanomicrobiaceae archaeon]